MKKKMWQLHSEQAGANRGNKQTKRQRLGPLLLVEHVLATEAYGAETIQG